MKDDWSEKISIDSFGLSRHTPGPSASPAFPEKMMKELILDVSSKDMEENKVIRSSQQGFIKEKH